MSKNGKIPHVESIKKSEKNKTKSRIKRKLGMKKRTCFFFFWGGALVSEVFNLVRYTRWFQYHNKQFSLKSRKLISTGSIPDLYETIQLSFVWIGTKSDHFYNPFFYFFLFFWLFCELPRMGFPVRFPVLFNIQTNLRYLNIYQRFFFAFYPLISTFS